jgi:SAM-dependent methyltransferase
VDHADHVNLLRAGVPAEAKVWADFGAGQGAFTLALAELLGPGGVIYAVDRDAGAVREAARSAGQRFPQVRVEAVAADFTRPLPPSLPPLDGAVMANALHFVPDARKPEVIQRVAERLKPGGRLLLVEYNVDRGNLWVPHPLTYERWAQLAGQAGFARTRLLARRPSSFLKEFFAAESVVD